MYTIGYTILKLHSEYFNVVNKYAINDFADKHFVYKMLGYA